ncbi:MAG: hypothetical protein ACXWQE_05255 [Bdellovibrionales bacterium]
MKKSVFKVWSMSVFTVLVSAAGHAWPEGPHSTMASTQQYENLTLAGVTVHEGETKTVSLGRSRHIRNIVVQAEGGGNDESSVEVMVNGEVKGTIYAPGNDPSYVVTVAETASSIQFRHRSGGEMKIHDIKATVSKWQGRLEAPDETHFNAGPADIVKLTRRLLRVTDDLKSYINIDDESHYITPIEIKANHVLIDLDVRGPNSQKAGVALLAMIQQIDFAQSFLEELMQAPATYDLAVELLSLREKIDDMID